MQPKGGPGRGQHARHGAQCYGKLHVRTPEGECWQGCPGVPSGLPAVGLAADSAQTPIHNVRHDAQSQLEVSNGGTAIASEHCKMRMPQTSECQ